MALFLQQSNGARMLSVLFRLIRQLVGWWLGWGNLSDQTRWTSQDPDRWAFVPYYLLLHKIPLQHLWLETIVISHGQRSEWSCLGLPVCLQSEVVRLSHSHICQMELGVSWVFLFHMASYLPPIYTWLLSACGCLGSKSLGIEASSFVALALGLTCMKFLLLHCW